MSYRSLRFVILSGLLAGLVLVTTHVVAAMPMQDIQTDTLTELSWPSVIQVDSGLVTFYQPQVDSMNGQRLYARAAVSYKETDGQPLFGIALFESRIEVDRDARTVTLVDLTVTSARFHGKDADFAQPLDKLVQSQVPTLDVVLSLDELLTSVAAAEELRKPADDFKTEPPAIVYSDRPALLVLIDGEPVFTDIENSSVKAVINTPYPLLKDGASYYLNAATDVWYRSSSVTGPWQFDAATPKNIKDLVPPPTGDEVVDVEGTDGSPSEPSEPITAANAPDIVVATKPTELLVTEGPPEYEPVTGNLKGITNSDNNVFYDSQTLLYYVVLSGRWYQSGAIAGPYTYIASDALPTDFANIPNDSDYNTVRANVAGTDEAREAIVDSYIPQTAAVERGEVKLDVEYDGDPKFEPVEDTSLEYAVNTGDSIIKSESRFYLVRDGVWYISSGPNGPWEVSDHAPAGVENIPPSNPTYNVKYVYVYESTPEVVYVGYTPGYYGSYVYGPTIVYGTGWYYHPWVTPYYYYPHYPTWGMHVSYNPWTGWGVGMSWSSGPFRFSFYSGGYWHHRHGWYHPPYGYHRRYPSHHHHHPNNRYRAPSQRANVARSTRPSNRPAQPGARPATRPSGGNAGARPATRPTTGSGGAATRPSTRPSTRDNNVYAGKDGNVYRKDNNGGWSKNSGGSWSGQGSASTRDRSTTNQLNKQQHSRDRSATRNNQYRSSGRSSSGGGGRSGGGGGRRR
ncbi:hypothetical protein ACFLRO_00640 [Bacteroidota bacterium]